MRRLMQWMERAASGRVVIVLFLLTIIFSLLLMISPLGVTAIEAKLPGIKLLEARHGYTALEVHEVFTAINTFARAEYIRFLLLDFVYITIYGSFFVLALTFVLRRLIPLKPYLTSLAGLGLLVALVDYLEGVLFLILLFQYPAQSLYIANAASIVTPAKLFAFYLCAAFSFGLYAAWIIIAIANRPARARADGQ
jgi:hypothetical protein